MERSLAKKRDELAKARRDLAVWTEDNFAKLTERDRNLHFKAFSNNADDPSYRELAAMTYHDGAATRQMQAPKGDVFHQFRRDVREGRLPTVSWIVAPERFSDHPSSPWYGAWYVSEALDILTRDPEVWKKTIFILCYDENDGYFDHIPPFVPAHPDRTETGKASAGIDTGLEHVYEEQAGPIGLGFRVPLVIASPWSRGGYVCSQVFDHTSILRLLEVFLSHKTGRSVSEPNITQWRRTVCGDLTSVFRPYNGEKIKLPAAVEREDFLGQIYQARLRPIPNDFGRLSAAEIAGARDNPQALPLLPQQEKGTRPSCALPYELAADGRLSEDRVAFTIQFAAARGMFGDRAAGAPFHVYGPCKSGWARSYAVSAGDRIFDQWLLTDFDGGAYHLRVHGPNGFYREFRGAADDPILEIALTTAGSAKLQIINRDPAKPLAITIVDHSYVEAARTLHLDSAGGEASKAILTLETEHSFGWHDIGIRVEGFPSFSQRFAGRIETGNDSFSDPFMGRSLPS